MDCGASGQARLALKSSSLGGCGMAVSLMSVLSRNAWLVVFLVLSSGSASAFDDHRYDNDRKYYEDENWTLSVNLARKACFMFTLNTGDYQVLLGEDRRGGTPAYEFRFSALSWKYEDGKKYEVVTRLDQYPAWTADGIGVDSDGLNGVAIRGAKVEAVEEFAAAKSFSLKIDGRDYGKFPLAGGEAALERMRECTDAIEDGRISLEAIARGEGVDFSVWPPRDPPLVLSLSPPPKKDETRPDDTPRGSAKGGPDRGKGKEPILASGPSLALDEDY